MLLAVLTAAALLAVQAPFGAAQNAAEEGAAASGTAESWSLPSYSDWLARQGDAAEAKDTIRLTAEDYLSSQPGNTAKAADGQILLGEGTAASFTVTSPKGGLYALRIGYEAVPGESQFSSALELSLAVNGETPYRECSRMTLSRAFGHTQPAFEQDEFGNDVQPDAQELTIPQEYTLSDGSGYHPEGLYILLQPGENTLTFTGVRGGIRLSWAELGPRAAVMNYADYRAAHDDEPQENAQAEPLFIEAENVLRKSDCTISPSSDRSSASVTPNSAEVMRLNTIGGSNYNTVGQWAVWQVDVKESGYYKIALHARQGANAGAVSSRKLLIDGRLPFEEAAALVFPYSSKYGNYVLSADGQELTFYLEAGRHEIALEVVLGPMAAFLEKVSAALTALNDDYLQILFYTGSKPDIYREYGFEKLIPEVLEDFRRQADTLEGVSEGIRALAYSRGDSTATLDRMADLLRRMADDTDEIARNFTLFNDNLSALGTWLNQYVQQPLQIDSIRLVPEGQQAEPVKDSFWGNLAFKFRIFLHSFLDDYAYAGGEGESKVVNVWLATGRDQSRVISRLSRIDAAKTGVSARVSLVAADALLPNVLAGSSIDVYVTAQAADPINYAIRGAVEDLTQFDDFEAVSQRFHPAAFTPFSYQGAVYALPESFDFPLMFYRRDIFAQLGLAVPETWDDFYETVAVLQKNNLTAGVLWSDMFNILLHQSGGSYYNEDKTASALDDGFALEAFENISRLYTDYGLPVEFSFPNRFRNGDMPLGILSYTMYNQLYLFAPEIDGLWAFTEVPGTINAQGEMDNGVIATGTGAILLRSAADKDAAWEFLKWWTSTETQTAYGIEMEKVMGPAGRQSSANLDVIRAYPWTAQESEVIERQWDTLRAIPQIPGSYYTQRTLDFAFNSVYSLGEDPARVLEENVRQLNDEIDRKMAEFFPQSHLPKGNDE